MGDKNNSGLTFFSQHVHSYIREYIASADRKSAFIFTIGSGLLAFLNQAEYNKIWMKSIQLWGLKEILATISLSGIGTAVFLSICVVVPNLTNNSNYGFIFWESILGFKSSELYTNRLVAATPTELNRALLEHCYILARVCNRKYKILYWSRNF